jgi:hypothetical protein
MMDRRFTVVTVAALLVVGCFVPTEQGADARLVSAMLPAMIVGDTVRLDVRFQDAGGQRPDASLRFESVNPAVAAVTADGLVSAVGQGETDILVWSPRLEDLPPARTPARVHAPVQVDSVRPVRVRYGEAVTLYGSGLDPATGSAVQIGGVPVPVAAYAPADPLRPERFGELEVIVAPPVSTRATEGRAVDITLTSGLGVASVVTPLVVEEIDRFEPNEMAPAELGVISSATAWQGLALEEVALEDAGIFPWEPEGVAVRRAANIDWYSFTTEEAGDWTISLDVEPTQREMVRMVLVPDAELAWRRTTNEWGETIDVWRGPDLSPVGADLCDGAPAYWDVTGVGAYYTLRPAYPAGITGAATPRFAVERLPAGTHHLIVIAGWMTSTVSQQDLNQWDLYADPHWDDRPTVRYDLTIEPGIRTDVAPDLFEAAGNDACDQAAPLVTLGDEPFADSTFTLSFDTQLDWDWYRLDATTHGILFAQLRSLADPAATDGAFVASRIEGLISHRADADVILDTDFGVLALQQPRLVGGVTSGLIIDDTRELTHIASCGCEQQGAVIQQGENILSISNASGVSGRYEVRLSWLPGVLPGVADGSGSESATRRGMEGRP